MRFRSLVLVLVYPCPKGMVLDLWDQGQGSRESCPLVVISMFFFFFFYAKKK